ncbi:uncharacterized protein C19orf44 homolog isoform X1 [Clarias gariepinus]|uniref:uncharacterized protein C19orf44 homolog isoform X1 n=1 Tax=Clarias gariepinus TaxID=13013 RepID=UPI00234CAEA9|nr:uncharacterized protein C19orf44 homolog isoform X1 [Clarias gariepinus]
MWNRGSSRSSALDRAKAHLSGQRVTNSGALREDQRRDVVSASFGKASQSRQMPVHGLSELSSDAESEQQDYHAHPGKIMRHSTKPVEHLGMGGGSRFLKKSTNRQSSPTDTNEVKFIPQRSSQSLALSRLALVEDRIRNQTNNKLSIDADLDSNEPSPAMSQSSNELSAADGSCLLKKKASSPKDHKGTQSPHVDIYKVSAHSASHKQKGISVDSDEEDMRKLLGESFKSPDGDYGMGQTAPSPQQAVQTYSKRSKVGVVTAQEHKEKHLVRLELGDQRYMSPSPSPLSSRRVSSCSKSFSQRADLTSSLSSVQDHSEIRSLKELFPSDHDETQSERSVLSDDFKVNVMTLDDLAPDTINIPDLSKEKSDASPQELCVPSAKVILHKKEDYPAQYESDFESEIQTETVQSVDDISEHLSGENEHSFVASEHQSLINKSNHNDTHSEKSFKSASINYLRSESSLTHRRGSDHTSYSTEDTQTHISPKRKKDATVQTKTEELAYMWSSGQAVLGPSGGMSYMDPTPVASHMIRAEAVEALTAYSPAVFALNDMLRQQLTLTRSFIQSSRHLHQAMLESLGPANYRYTTLEDTKEFIRSNKPPKLTIEDALEEVLQEMRDYHYI